MRDCYSLQISTFGMQKSIQKKPLITSGREKGLKNLYIATRGLYYSEARIKGDFPFKMFPFTKGKIK